MESTVSLAVTYPLYNLNAERAMRCAVNYDVAEATQLLTGASTCRTFVSTLNGALLSEAASVVLSGLVAIYHATHAWYWLWCVSSCRRRVINR